MPDTDPPRKKFWLQAGQISQVAFVLPASTVVGWLLGAGMDRWLHTSWLWIAGLLLGIVAGFVEMIRTVIANSK